VALHEVGAHEIAGYRQSYSTAIALKFHN